MNFKHFFTRVNDKLRQYNIGRIFRITYDVTANILLFFVIIAVLLGIFAGGVGAGYFASLVKDEDIRSYEDMKKDIYNYEETSKLYFADNIYIGDIRSDLHREEIALEDMSDLVKQAVIATEDELFYEHKGVVPKAIFRALFQEATNSSQKTGGSTLTQQLIKNQLLTNEVSFERKAKEILLALRLENFFEKDEILEAYLNIVPYGREASGRNIAGVQAASRGIFGVDADELNLPQAAYLAGLPQNPFTYTPFTNTGEVKDEEELSFGLKRMETVLLRMYQTNIIDETEYKKALEYDVVADFTEKSISPIDEYPAIVLELEQRAIKILKEILAEEDGYTIEDIEADESLDEEYSILADRALRRNGYHISSTINKDMYDTMQRIVSEYQYYGPDRTFTKDGETKTEPVENGVVLIENNTGKVLSFVPGRNYRAGDNEYNYATQAYRSPGSTFKPFTYAAGFDLGKLQPGSVIADVPTKYGDYSPKNYGGAYYGLVTAREAITYSYNVSAVRAYSEIIDEDPIDKYFSKLGFSSIDQSEAGNRALALGGLTYGVTVEENTGAFAALGNDGAFNETYMIEEITDNDGNLIYKHEVEPVEVFSPETAYLTIDTMRDVVKKGTGTFTQSELKYRDVDWAGKTGTSQEYRDAWFVGVNPNVTIGSWIGYDTPSSIFCPSCALSYHPRNIKVWAQIVNELTDQYPDLMAPKEKFKQPEGIVKKSFCATSGLLPSKLCKQAGLVSSDIFNEEYVPTKKDDSLIGGSMPLVKIDGDYVIAHNNTPSEFISRSSGGIMFNPEFLKDMGYDKLDSLSSLIPRKNKGRWGKIGLARSSSSAKTIDKDKGGRLSAPKNIKASGTTISWTHTKGQLIVGYRIYNASNNSVVGHTVNSSYTLSSRPGSYYVRAVNYFGKESKSSSRITVKQSVKEKSNSNNSSDTNNKQDSDKTNKNNHHEDSKPTDQETNEPKDKNNDEKKDEKQEETNSKQDTSNEKDIEKEKEQEKDEEKEKSKDKDKEKDKGEEKDTNKSQNGEKPNDNVDKPESNGNSNNNGNGNDSGNNQNNSNENSQENNDNENES